MDATQFIIQHWASAAGAATSAWLVGLCIYRLYLHPLAQYPGPKIAALSELWNVWAVICGRYSFVMNDAHKKYGDIVRTGPNQLSFSSPQAYKTIYGHATRGNKPFAKGEFYNFAGDHPSIIHVRDGAEHSRQRKYLSNAFSAKSLSDQEFTVHHYVDQFVDQLVNISRDQKRQGVPVVEGFNWLTFDIIGDLAFGESFGAIAEARTHPWISIIMEAAFWRNLTVVQRQYPVLSKIFMSYVVPKDAPRKLALHYSLSKEKALKRMEMGNEDIGRKDFFSHLISKGGSDLPLAELQNQASSLVIAGSETTATNLATIVYLLLRHPGVMKKLQDEVRSAFSASDEITATSASHLPYMQGVIQEGLRLLPPAAFGMPRVCPGTEIEGKFVPAGTTVTTEMWTTSHDPRYWEDAESFRPERWLGEGGALNQPPVFWPFSLGPRSCLGINLAYLEMRVILAKMVYSLDWELVTTDVDYFGGARQYFLWQKPEFFVKFYKAH